MFCFSCLSFIKLDLKRNETKILGTERERANKETKNIPPNNIYQAVKMAPVLRLTTKPSKEIQTEI